MDKLAWASENRQGGIIQGKQEERDRCLKIIAEVAAEYKDVPPALKEVEHRIKQDQS